MNPDNNNNNEKWLSDDKIAENIGHPSSSSFSTLSLDQISNLLITHVLSEIELDSKNINISNTESLQTQIHTIITSILDKQFRIYEQLLHKAESDIRFYASQLLKYRIQDDSNRTYIQYLLGQLEEYQKIKKQFDFIVSTDITADTEDTLNELLQLKEENSKLKLKIKELEIRIKENGYLHYNENYCGNCTLFNNHHQRINSISSSSIGNQMSPVKDNNAHVNKMKMKVNSVRISSCKQHPILDSLISPKSPSKHNYNKNGNDCCKSRLLYKQNKHSSLSNNNNTLTDDMNKFINTKSSKVNSHKKEYCFVNEFLSMLKNNKENKSNSNCNNNNSIIKNTKHQKYLSQYKLPLKNEETIHNTNEQTQKQLIKNYYNNFIIYRNNNNLLNAKSKHFSYQNGVLSSENATLNRNSLNTNNSNLLKTFISNTYNNTITVNSKSNSSNKQSTRQQKIIKKTSTVNMGLIYSHKKPKP